MADCTGYNEAINYNAPIPYNGVCVSPTPTTPVVGGYVLHDYHRKREDLDEIGLIISLLELSDD